MDRGESEILAASLSGNERRKEQGTDVRAIPFKGGSHIIQRAAPPAREPGPVVMDVIARAITPAGVEQFMSGTTSRFSALGFVHFRADATFFVRLPACFFVSHNSGPFSCSPFLLLRSHINRFGSGL
jgi:hypothetical protein